MTIRQIVKSLSDMLSPAVGAVEAYAMAQIIVEDVKGYTKADVAIYGHRELLPDTEDRMLKIANMVLNGMPLQYAIGTAQFRGRNFKVTPATLIPRPETAQLVDMITKDWNGKADLRILDIGTGSGCIAISLAIDLPFATVDALDISQDAVNIAQENAKALGAKYVKAVKADALHLDDSVLKRSQYDIIVSNPPYVLQSEKAAMDARVKDYEPSTALFVPDDDPLLFYKPIASFATKHLAPQGKLYLEINPLCAKAIHSLLLSAGFDNVDILPDYLGNIRFAIAQK